MGVEFSDLILQTIVFKFDIVDSSLLLTAVALAIPRVSPNANLSMPMPMHRMVDLAKPDAAIPSSISRRMNSTACNMDLHMVIQLNSTAPSLDTTLMISAAPINAASPTPRQNIHPNGFMVSVIPLISVVSVVADPGDLQLRATPRKRVRIPPTANPYSLSTPNLPLSSNPTPTPSKTLQR